MCWIFLSFSTFFYLFKGQVVLDLMLSTGENADCYTTCPPPFLFYTGCRGRKWIVIPDSRFVVNYIVRTECCSKYVCLSSPCLIVLLVPWWPWCLPPVPPSLVYISCVSVCLLISLYGWTGFNLWIHQNCKSFTDLMCVCIEVKSCSRQL